ncbi:MAG TPA: aromatic hydrocarbon degradation protein [Dysgonomonas sp.]|nr:aromatic hydrocarbon degradation protein [Dysgonomonas sp.]
MNKAKLAAVAALLNISASFAGGILTNTNQSIHFLRNPARDASTQIDAVYTNPAGLIKLPEGFHFSFNNQSAFQTRTITSTYKPFEGFGGNITKEYEGKASAPIIPSLQGVYRKGKWALSGSFAVSGGGGKATFNNGLPSFESNIAGVPVSLSNAGISTTQYSVDQYMRGSSFIYGAQLGGTYEINEMFSAYAGFRLNIVNNGYEGHLRNIMINPAHPTINPTGGMMLATDFFNAASTAANGVVNNLTPLVEGGAGDFTLAQLVGAGQMTPEMANQLAVGIGKSPEDLNSLTVTGVRTAYAASAEANSQNAKNVADKYLDSSQTGWGISPIIGFNFSYDKLNIGIKYEFETNLNVENKTKRDDTGMFKDGVNTPHDIPALLTIGASYYITPRLQASIGYHHFFDSNAKMSLITDPNNPDQKIGKEKYAGSTNEYLAGLEYRLDDMFLISAGGQITRYGVKNHYQSDLSFVCDSYSIGLGGEITVSPKVKINIGYFWTNYSDYTKEPGGGTSKDVFSRTNKVFGAGVDFSF